MVKTVFDLKILEKNVFPVSLKFSLLNKLKNNFVRGAIFKNDKKKKNCLAHFRVTFTKFSGALLQVKRRD